MNPVMDKQEALVPTKDKIIVLVNFNHWIGLKRYKGKWYNLDSQPVSLFRRVLTDKQVQNIVSQLKYPSFFVEKPKKDEI